MKKVLGFYRTFLQTLNPSSYEGFSESRAGNTFKYFFTLMLNALVVMLIVMIPLLVTLPNTLGSYFNSIDNLMININFTTKEPIAIPKDHPLIIINSANETPSQSAKVILNNNMLYFGMALNQNQINFSEYKNVKAKSGDVSNVLTFLLVLMIPMLLLLLFLYSTIKFFLIAVAAAFVSIFIAMIMKRKIGLGKLFNIAMYGISATVFLELIFFALGFWFYYIQYLPLLIIMIAGISQAGEKVDSKMKGKYLEVKG